MGGALLRGWRQAGLSVPFIIRDPSFDSSLISDFDSVVVNPDDRVLAELSPRIIVLAVKPQIASSVVPSLFRYVPAESVVISLMAGIRLSRLTDWLGAERLYVRVMPNIAATVLAAMSVAVASDGGEHKIVSDLLEAVGDVAWVGTERDIDLCTAVCGSGPAYVFALAETMIAGGIEIGLSPDLARQLTHQTIMGAGLMLAVEATDSSVLRTSVTSPAGTTEAALRVLMPDLSDLMSRALMAAAARARVLAEG